MTDTPARPRLSRRLGLTVAVLVLSTVPLVTGADAQAPLEQERVQRVREFLSRLIDSPCLNNDRCQSWLGDYKLGAEDAVRALREMDQALSHSGRLQGQIARLENVRRQAELDAESMRQRLASLTKDAVDKALAVLAEQHFGMEARNPADILGHQIGETAARLKCGDQQVIVTIFGYFIHDHEIDLAQGEKTFKLVFQPFPFASGGRLGQAIDEYAKKAQLSLEPQLEVAARSIEITMTTPAREARQPLHPTYPGDWRWALKQSPWSSVTETDGAVAIKVSSPQGTQVLPSLTFKVKGRPWWWFVTYIWEKWLQNPQAWAVAVVAAVIGWRRGLIVALRWLWGWTRRQAGGGRAGGP